MKPLRSGKREAPSGPLPVVVVRCVRALGCQQAVPPLLRQKKGPVSSDQYSASVHGIGIGSNNLQTSEGATFRRPSLQRDLSDGVEDGPGA